MQHKLKLFLVLSGIAAISLFAGCDRSTATGRHAGEEPQTVGEDILTLPVLFHQSAAEYRALCYQAFNMARLALDMDMRRAGLSMQQAIIADIDETLLDNSPYEAYCALENVSYPEGWDTWIETASAATVPGALEFLKYAESKGVVIFYVTNRREKYRAPTLRNMQTHGFPFADDNHLLMRTEENSKKERRAKVAENHRIIMLIGDNLADFSEVFEEKTATERNRLVDDQKDHFGTLFITLPNVMYGDWEGALYYGMKEPGIDDKRLRRREALNLQRMLPEKRKNR